MATHYVYEYGDDPLEPDADYTPPPRSDDPRVREAVDVTRKPFYGRNLYRTLPAAVEDYNLVKEHPQRFEFKGVTYLEQHPESTALAYHDVVLARDIVFFLTPEEEKEYYEFDSE